MFFRKVSRLEDEVIDLQGDVANLQDQVRNLISAYKQEWIKNNPPKYDGKEVTGRTCVESPYTYCPAMITSVGIAVFAGVKEFGGKFCNTYRIKDDNGLSNEIFNEFGLTPQKQSKK